MAGVDGKEQHGESRGWMRKAELGIGYTGEPREYYGVIAGQAMRSEEWSRWDQGSSRVPLGIP